MTIRVYIVEDHPVMRESLRDLLAFSPDIETSGEAESAEQASAEIAGAAPSLVLVDLSLPRRSGLELLAEVRERWGLPCVVLSGHGERTHVARAFEAGASGYVLKGQPGEIVRAIRTVAAGGTFVSDVLARSALQDERSVGA